MGKKKILLIVIFAFILCIGIGVIIYFFWETHHTFNRDSSQAQPLKDSANIKYLQDSNDGKTIHIRIGNTLILSTSWPVDAVYLTNNTILQPVSGVTEVSSAAPPTPYVYGLTDTGKPTFRVVSAGGVEIIAPYCGITEIECEMPVGKYHFKVIATE